MTEQDDYHMIVDFWRMLKHFRNTADEDDYWAAFHNACETFVKRNHNARLAKDLALALGDELERRCLR